MINVRHNQRLQKYDFRAQRNLNGEMVADVEGVEVQLNNVLVVQDLPVPLHISAKAEPDMLATGAFNSGTDNMEKMIKESFPKRYRDHPYWIPNGVIYLGISSEIQELSAGIGGLELGAARGMKRSARAAFNTPDAL